MQFVLLEPSQPFDLLIIELPKVPKFGRLNRDWKKLNSWPQEKQWVLLYIPAQIGFPIGGDRVTCGWWKLAMVSSYGEQNSLIPKGNNNLNFRLVRDQLVILETAADL